MKKGVFYFTVTAENSTLAAFSAFSIFIHFCISAFKSKDCVQLIPLFTLGLSLKFTQAETFPLQCKL